VFEGCLRGHLILKLLGPPEIVHAGLPVHVRIRKSLALLVYLAV
jgi:DNA-binding SARP family transcriptional activator